MDKSKFNDKKEWRKFGYGVAIILSILATLQLILGKELYPYFYGTAALFLVLALLTPILIKPVFIIFSYLGHVMGWIMTRVILTILFFFIITPIGTITKLARKNFLDLRISPSTESYWTDRDRDQDRIKKYENQY